MLDETIKHAGAVKTLAGVHVITATIAESASLSGAIDLSAFKYITILMPAAWDAANLTFQACDTATGTFQDVYGDDGTEISVTAAASRAIVVNAKQASLLPLSHIKIRSGTTGTPVAQTAARTIKLICKG